MTGKAIRGEKEEIKKLKQENAQVKNQVKQLTDKMSKVQGKVKSSGAILAKAADDPLPKHDLLAPTSVCQYVRSLVLPVTGDASIPDDSMSEKVSRTEPITCNVTAPPSGQGLFILLPNFPGSLVGWHYTFDGTAYTLTTALVTAQDLALNYDYGRKVSQVVTIKSATLPSGVYALAGTFNGVTMTGTISEFTSYKYSDILTANDDPFGKVGNVLAGDGVTSLMLPYSMNSPYHRLSDVAPAVSALGIVDASRVYDGADDLVYRFNSHSTNKVIALQGAAYIHTETVTYLVDASIGLEVQGDVAITNVVGGNGTKFGISVAVTYYDPFGNVILSNQVYKSMIFWPQSTGIGSVITIGFSQQKAVNWQPSGTGIFPNGEPPVGQIQIDVTVGDADGTVAPTITTATSTIVRSWAAAKAGMCTPVQLIAYQGMVSSSQIAVSGVANFELIPNPTLRQNIKMEYPRYNPGEMEYAKMLMAMRRTLGIRSLWNDRDYQADREILYRLCDMNQLKHRFQTTSMALDAGPIVTMLKNRVLPFMYDIFPETRLIGQGIGALYNRFTSKAASGNVMVSRAFDNEDIVQLRIWAAQHECARLQQVERDTQASAWAHGVIKQGFDPVPVEGCESNPCSCSSENIKEHTSYAMDRPLSYKQRIALLGHKRVGGIDPLTVYRAGTSVGVPKGVMFPTVTCDSLGEPVGFLMYICIPGNASALLNPKLRNPKVRNGHRIYGLKDSDDFPFPLNSDLTLLPIVPHTARSGPNIEVVEGPPVAGSSFHTAAWLVCHGTFRGILKAAVTGGVDAEKRECLPNPVFEEKQAFCHNVGIALAGNDERADCRIRELDPVKGGLPDFSIALNRIVPGYVESAQAFVNSLACSSIKRKAVCARAMDQNDFGIVRSILTDATKWRTRQVPVRQKEHELITDRLRRIHDQELFTAMMEHEETNDPDELVKICTRNIRLFMQRATQIPPPDQESEEEEEEAEVLPSGQKQVTQSHTGPSGEKMGKSTSQLSLAAHVPGVAHK